jgi:hypothetical protein
MYEENTKLFSKTFPLYKQKRKSFTIFVPSFSLLRILFAGCVSARWKRGKKKQKAVENTHIILKTFKA